MTAITEKHHPGGCIITTEDGHMSFEEVTLLSGQNLYPDTVLGKITASGKYAQHDPGSPDGRGTAVAVLYDRVDATGGDTTCTIIARLAEVNGNELILNTGSPGATLAQVTADLALQNIIVRS